MNSYTLADISPGMTADFTWRLRLKKWRCFLRTDGRLQPHPHGQGGSLCAKARLSEAAWVSRMLGASLFLLTLAGVYLPR